MLLCKKKRPHGIEDKDFTVPDIALIHLIRNMQLFYQPLLLEGVNHLDSDESRHAVKVLRYKEGDEITIIDGKGNFYTAKILDSNQRKCTFTVIEKRTEKRTTGYRHIAIAPTKNIDRIEWFVEKAVEIGIDRISFVKSHNSERTVIKTERIERKAISAMKQSIKAKLPQIDEIVSLKAFLQEAFDCNKFIAHVDFDNPKHLKDEMEIDNLVLIGPEGDFSDEELSLAADSGYVKVSLGESRLRTETAGIVAAHILNL